MPKLVHIRNLANFTPLEGEIITFYVAENGKIILKAKKSDGSVVTILEEK